MYYTIYKITNKINGKFYIGSHKTKNLDDRYMGSGKYLIRAQEKYGLENFEKEILFIYDNPEEMYSKEAEIVNEEFLMNENTYNLKLGGYGGWDFNNTSEGQLLRQHSYKKWSQAGNRAFLEKLVLDETFRNKILNQRKELGKQTSLRMKEKWKSGEFSGFSGKIHSDETKCKLKEAAKNKHNGEKNSQYGTKWIYSETLKISKKISKLDDIPDGWKEGRKIKFKE